MRPVTRIGQVVDRVLQARTEIVVAAEHEDTGTRQQVTQALHHCRHRFGVGQVVAGVDDQVGLPPRPARAATLVCAADWAACADR